MNMFSISLRELTVAPIVHLSFALLVFPFAGSVLDSRLSTPLAIPGYVVFVLMTVVGNIHPLTRRFGFRLYWVPFVTVCYGLSLVVGAGYYLIRQRGES